MIIQADSKTFFVFDLDDTIYYELDFLRSSFRNIAKLIEPEWSEGLFNEMMEVYISGGNTFLFLTKKYPEKNISVADLLELYRNHYPEISLRNGVREFLERIKNRGAGTGILTNGRSTTQRNKLKALKVDGLFDEIVISEEIGFEKPDESAYNLFKIRYQDYFFHIFGDNPLIDFVVPKRLGWNCIGVNGEKNINHFNMEDLSVEYLPNSFIDSFLEIDIE